MSRLTVIRTRDILFDFIVRQALRRSQKAVEYGDDERNVLSADALLRLADYVFNLPETDESLAMLAELSEYLMPRSYVLDLGPEAAHVVSRYEFNRLRRVDEPDWQPESPSDFLDSFVSLCQLEAEEHDTASVKEDPESLEDRAMSDGALQALQEFDEDEDEDEAEDEDEDA